MEESLKLSQKQKLQQTLSPLQVQFVRALEMTGPEIEEEVARAVDENPALEVVDEAPIEQYDESAEELQLADYRNEDEIPHYRLETDNHSADDSWYEPVAVVGGGSLMEQLMEQLAQMKLTERQLVVAKIITGNIDDNGYVTRSLTAIADDAAIMDGVEVSIEEVKTVWNIVRSLDPAGVGAVDLRDCLLLQLQRKQPSREVSLAIEIVEHNFDLFSRMDFDRLARTLRCSREDLIKAVGVIRSLNPKPGSGALPQSEGEDRMRQISPDFLVEVDGGNLSLTSLNHIPSLQIESSFANADIEVSPRVAGRQAEALAFIRQRRDDAANFIKLLSMRQETMLRVMTAILKFQRDFFLTEDESNLKPMILKDVAALTGYDISVVSRATNGKYVATRSRIYPLKFFFNESPTDDSDTSTHEITAALREIVEEEDKSNPLSDDALTEALQARGYSIARRTVSKYREKLLIPVARLRRKI